MLDVDVATFPTTIWDIATAIGTVSAVLAALSLGLYDGRVQRKRQAEELRRLETERDQARAARDAAEALEATRIREAQARKVAIWTEDDPKWAPSLPRTVMAVGNFSDAPVFNLVVEFQTHEGPIDFKSIPSLKPGEMRTLEQRNSIIGLPDPRQIPEIIEECVVTFRDVVGIVWTRDLTGALAETPGAFSPF